MIDARIVLQRAVHALRQRGRTALRLFEALLTHHHRLIQRVLGAAFLVLAPFSGLPFVLAAGGLAIIALGEWRSKLRPEQAGTASPGSDESLPEARDAAFEAVSIPVMVLDRQGHIRHANSLARQAFPGLREGMPISFATRSPDILEAVEQVIAGRPLMDVAFIERIPVERSFDVRICQIPHSETETALANTHFAVISLTDTTKARRVEAMRVDFVANASHELRTPLASIIGFIETLQGPARNDAAVQQKFLLIMAQQGRRMARLIDDLLSLSRIELSEHLHPTGEVELTTTLGHIVEALSGLAKERGVTLRITEMPETALAVNGDRDELLRVFENLIENAIKYGASGQRVEIALTVAAHSDARNEASISIRDYGPGIPAEHLPRLTERFYRADVEASRAQGGTGLGLAIVKHILNRHRGRLMIESQPGNGAVFIVKLPLL